jgi:hypothetical protein
VFWVGLRQTVTFVLYIVNRLVFIAEVESVYCAVGLNPIQHRHVSSLKG